MNKETVKRNTAGNCLFVHIGNQVNVRVSDIIGVFDADATTVSHITRKYLSRAESEGRTASAVLEIPKSFLLYEDKKDKNNPYKIYFSQLSTAALLGRIFDE